MQSRISEKFESLAKLERKALITFLMASDPDDTTSLAILKALPSAGADIIELGMPFTDPMADGPAIQAAALRALQGGASLKKTLGLVEQFRAADTTTPIVLMGYYNPIYIYGVERFLLDAKSAGVDGLIVVDLPPEEDAELYVPARKAGLDFIRLATPTTDDIRLEKILSSVSGFVYYVSITGVTGAATPNVNKVSTAVTRIRSYTHLPIAVGFGVKNAETAALIAESSDAVVVGSAIVDALKASLDTSNRATQTTVGSVTNLVTEISAGLKKNIQPV